MIIMSKKGFWSKKEKKVLEKEMEKDKKYWDNIGDKIYVLYSLLPIEHGYTIDIDYSNHTFVLYKTPTDYIRKLNYTYPDEYLVFYEGRFEDYKEFKKFVNKRVIYSPARCFVYLMTVLCVINWFTILIKIIRCFKDVELLNGISCGIIISMLISLIVDLVFTGKNSKNRKVCYKDGLFIDDKILTSYTREILKDMKKEDKEVVVKKRGRKKKAEVDSDNKNN